ncbi:MAG: hypothetical protein F2840_06660 [Actinobacteria bacterium]|nr:hypothetical protein [Actinomycetota bacterium]
MNSYDVVLDFMYSEPNTRAVISSLKSWLAEAGRGFDVDLSETRFMASESGELAVIRKRATHGFELLARMVERKPTGDWTSEVSMHANYTGTSWVRVKVVGSSGRPAKIPRLAASIMNAVPVFSGPVLLTAAPERVGVSGVDDLIDLLCEPDRDIPLFITGTASFGIPFDPYAERFAKWTRQVRGLSNAYILDPIATEEFRAQIGDEHSVAPWTVRTFLPGVDPATAADAIRHRVLGSSKLGQLPDGAIETLFGRIARGLAANRPIPGDVRRTERALRRVEDALFVDRLRESVHLEEETHIQLPVAESSASVVPTGSASAEAESYLIQVEWIREALGLEELSEEALRDVALRASQGRVHASALEGVTRRLQDGERARQGLEDELELLKTLAEDDETDLALLSRTLSEREAEVRWLRSKLREEGDFEAATNPIPPSALTQYPTDFTDFLVKVEELRPSGVIFCGNPKSALDLDDLDTLSQAVRTAWDACLVLSDYIRVRRELGLDMGIQEYIKNPRGGRTVGPKKFVKGETGRTMRDHGEERVLPVPISVDATGFTTMKAHFRLAKIGMKSPRMYVLDRFSLDGCLYIGFIGVHMTNTKTS